MNACNPFLGHAGSRSTHPHLVLDIPDGACHGASHKCRTPVDQLGSCMFAKNFGVVGTATCSRPKSIVSGSETLCLVHALRPSRQDSQ